MLGMMHECSKTACKHMGVLADNREIFETKKYVNFIYLSLTEFPL